MPNISRSSAGHIAVIIISILQKVNAGADVSAGNLAPEPNIVF